MGGKVGRGSENKVPFVAAVSLDEKNHPCFVKFTPVPGFTLKALATWAKNNLAAGCLVLSDGLPGFRALTTAGCQHQVLVSDGRVSTPSLGVRRQGVNTKSWCQVEKGLKTYQNLSGFTVLGNLKTSLAGTYHAFNFGEYGTRYLAKVAYRFNRRFRLDILPQRLLFAAICCPPHTEAWLRWG